MSFKEELAGRTRQADAVIRQYLPAEEGYQQLLLQAMNYSVNAGGKRLRPVLIQLAFEMCGGSGALAEPFMAAMEMIHTHSLIHDDLPVMDNDRYRRGRETTWVVYGEAMAVLAGDGLLNHAYETAAKAFDMTDDPARVGRALALLARKTGISGMIGGQSVDVQNDGKPLGEDLLSFIYALKTGALLEASLMIGGVLAGADDQTVLSLEQIGTKIGLAFQIQDDLLDVTGDEKKLGKSIGSDEKNQKTTYVTLHGIDSAAEKVKTLTDEAVQLADTLPAATLFFKELLFALAGRDH